MKSVTLFNFSNPQHTIYKANLQGYELDEHFWIRMQSEIIRKAQAAFSLTTLGEMAVRSP